MILSMLRRLLISKVMGMLKGKTAINLKKLSCFRKENLSGKPLLESWYCVSTIGLDEMKTRKYVKKYQEEREKKRRE